MRDLYNNIEVRRAESPLATAQTNNDPIVSEIIDMRGFKSMCFLVVLGTLADAAFTTVVLLEHGDDSGLSDNAAVPNEQMLPMLTPFAEATMAFDQDDDDEVRKMGYVGEKRYVRLTITPSDNTGDLPIAIVALMGDADRRPTTAQAT